MAAKRPIYLDHHATTPVDPRVVEAMLPYLREDFGNASSASHAYGWRAEGAVEDARERIAARLGARPREIVFTSGATESNNLAIFGAARARRAHRDRIVTVATEHPAVLDPCRALEREGFELTVLGVDTLGRIDLAELAAAIDERTALVSVMAANSEIGVLSPLDAIGTLCREHGATLHSDAAQAAGKVALDLAQLPVDLLSVSGHKIYAPKGVGALFVRASRPRVRLEPLFYGGGQEHGLRPGTLPVASIVALALALEISLDEREVEAKRLTALRDGLLATLRAGLSGVEVNGDLEHRLPGNLNVSFADVDGERLLLALPDLAISTGSACSSASPEPSHVLTALGVKETRARASIRFGLGRGTTATDVETAGRRVVEAVRGLGRTA